MRDLVDLDKSDEFSKPLTNGEVGSRRGASGFLFRWSSVAILAAFLGVAIGFAGFVRHINAVASVQPAASADAIVVLTGGQARLRPAAALLREQKGERLLISGVHREIASGSLINALNIEEQLFSCCVDVDRNAMDTIGNARETARWVAENGYSSLIVVTNDYHMPRSMVELQRAMPDVALHPNAIVNDRHENDSSLDRYRVLGGEYVKLLLSHMRGWFS